MSRGLLPEFLRERYHPLRELGAGAFGRVVLAQDGVLDQTVAIKLLETLFADHDALGRFRHEAEVTAGLQHPHIVRVLDTGNGPEGEAFIVYEAVAGRDLRGVLRRGGAAPAPVREPLALAWTVRIAQALAAAHQQGVIHRDVKPENVLLREADSWPLLCDFGLATSLRRRGFQTATGTLLGTPEYLAPEMWFGAEASPASDQFALGALLFELLYARPAYGSREVGEVYRQAQAGFEPTLPEGADRPVHAVLRRMLSEKPGERFPDLEAVAAALWDEGWEAGRVSGEYRPVTWAWTRERSPPPRALLDAPPEGPDLEDESEIFAALTPAPDAPPPDAPLPGARLEGVPEDTPAAPARRGPALGGLVLGGLALGLAALGLGFGRDAGPPGPAPSTPAAPGAPGETREGAARRDLKAAWIRWRRDNPLWVPAADPRRPAQLLADRAVFVSDPTFPLKVQRYHEAFLAWLEARGGVDQALTPGDAATIHDRYWWGIANDLREARVATRRVGYSVAEPDASLSDAIRRGTEMASRMKEVRASLPTVLERLAPLEPDLAAHLTAVHVGAAFSLDPDTTRVDRLVPRVAAAPDAHWAPLAWKVALDAYSRGAQRGVRPACEVVPRVLAEVTAFLAGPERGGEARQYLRVEQMAMRVRWFGRCPQAPPGPAADQALAEDMAGVAKSCERWARASSPCLESMYLRQLARDVLDPSWSGPDAVRQRILAATR